MKIKRERQVRLDELLRLVWDREVAGEKFYDQENNVLFIDKKDGEIKQADHTCKSDLFAITEEVEIKESTNLPRILVVKGTKQAFTMTNKSIKRIKNNITDLEMIYLQNPDGSIGDLIWSKEKGMVN